MWRCRGILVAVLLVADLIPRSQGLVAGSVDWISRNDNSSFDSDYRAGVQNWIDVGDYAAAAKMAREALASVQSEHGPQSFETAEALELLVEALWRSGKADQVETLELADRAQLIREQQLGPNHALVAASLVGKAKVLYERIDLPAAEALLLRALEIYGEELTQLDPRIGQIHSSLGDVYRQAGNLEESTRQYEAAIKILEGSAGEDSLDISAPLFGLAGVLDFYGRESEAKSLYQRVLSIRERELGAKHPEVAGVYLGLGYVEWQLGHYEEAQNHTEHAVALREEALEPKHPDLADSLSQLALLVWFGGAGVGDPDEIYKRAFVILDQLPPQHSAPNRARYAYGLSARGDLVGARQYRERAIELIERFHGPEHPWLAMTLFYQGDLLYQLGEDEQARSCYERSIAITTKVLGADHQSIADPLTGLARLAERRGDLPEATQLLERALALNERAWGENHESFAGVLKPYGEILQKRGDYVGASRAFQKALEIDVRTLGHQHNRVAMDLILMADLNAELGDYQTALSDYRAAIAIMDIEPGRDNPDPATELKVAYCLARTEKLGEAFESALRSERASRKIQRLNLEGLEERLALQRAAQRKSGLDLIVSILLTDKSAGSVAATLDEQIRSRALVLDVMAERHRWVSADPDAVIAAQARDLARARNKLASLAVQGPPDPAQKQEYLALLLEARDDRDRAERRLAESNPSFRSRLEVKAAGLSEVEDALPAGSGLLSLVRFQRTDFGAGEIAKPSHSDEDWYSAFVFTGTGGEPVLLPLGEATEIDGLVGRVRQQMSDVSRAPVWALSQAESQYRDAAVALRSRIWDPVAPHVRGLEVLFIVPDGELHLINFSALPSEDGEYLIESGPRLHYLSAERDLLDMGHDGEKGGLLAVGDPAFDEAGLFAALAPEQNVLVAETPKFEESHTGYYRGPRSACGSFQTLEFSELPATGGELREITQLWQEASLRSELREEGHTAESAVLLSRAEANETAFKAQSAGNRVIHLATHGFFLGGRCPSAFGVEETPDRGAIVVGENPLLLAGLAMAGANHREMASADEEDGILTAEEIAALDLTGVNWAVLSACDTGIGETKAGEGVFGLRRAFEIAGVDSLIMSLWRVQDTTTREWMNLLYERRFVDGLSTIDAVHQSSLELLHRRRDEGLSTHPFYWAGFVAAGDWQ